MSVKLHIKKGDQVQVIAGDGKGQTGKVLKVEVSKQRAIVEGVNLCKKATKPNAQNPQGGIIEKEAPIHVSNLMLIDPKSGKPISRISVGAFTAGLIRENASKVLNTDSG